MTAADEALIVIDMQRGAFDGARCPAIPGAAPLLDAVLSLLGAARQSDVPVLFVQHLAGPEGVLAEGSEQAELLASLTRRDDERLVTKRRGDAFECTDLADRLRALGVRRIVICGLQSERCVTDTVLGALKRGLAVTLAADGHGTWPSETASASELVARVNMTLGQRGAVPLPRCAIEAGWRR